MDQWWATCGAMGGTTPQVDATSFTPRKAMGGTTTQVDATFL